MPLFFVLRPPNRDPAAEVTSTLQAAYSLVRHRRRGGLAWDDRAPDGRTRGSLHNQSDLNECTVAALLELPAPASACGLAARRRSMAAGLATTVFASVAPGLAAIGGDGTGGIRGHQVVDIHYEFNQGTEPPGSSTPSRST